ncbi:MAG: hypothetical protein AAFV80_00875 [Bacteroidota bacterium]
MADWIFPLSILPGIGMIIMSTTHWASSLAGEINGLLKEDFCPYGIVKQKIQQLQILHIALVLLYISASMFALGGFIGSIWSGDMSHPDQYVNTCMSLGMVVLLAAMFCLIVYAFRAVRIKHSQFLSRLKAEEKKTKL